MFMVMMISNPCRFHVIDFLPDGTKFDTTYFLDDILCHHFSLGYFLREEKSKKTIYHLTSTTVPFIDQRGVEIVSREIRLKGSLSFYVQ
jgi:hypothetical protein